MASNTRLIFNRCWQKCSAILWHIPLLVVIDLATVILLAVTVAVMVS